MEPGISVDEYLRLTAKPYREYWDGVVSVKAHSSNFMPGASAF